MSKEPKQKKVSSLDDLRKSQQERSQGIVMELPSGLVVKVRRPLISNLLTEGLIPQELIGIALKLQSGGDIQTLEEIQKSVECVRVIVREAILEPSVTPEDVKNMDDDDKGFIMNYVQEGARALQSFRNDRPSKDAGPDLQ